MRNQKEVIIHNATVADGTGGPCFQADVSLSGGNISRISRKAPEGAKSAKTGDDRAFIREGPSQIEIDGAGLVLTPGFIDNHGHSDVQLFHDPSVFNKAEQGITTEISGMCGVTMAPVNPHYFRELREYVEPFTGSARMPETEDWRSMTGFDAYLQHVEALQLGINMAFFVGHGTLRIAAMGLEERDPGPGDLDTMRGLLREAMDSGARGMSAGLVYSPGIYSKTEELIFLCRTVAEYDGVFSVHLRNESDGILKALEEALNIARASGVRLVLSHHKIGGLLNRGLSRETLAMVESARAEGLDVALDQYPYTSAASILSVTIPARFLSGGTAGLLKRLADSGQRCEIAAAMERPDPSWDSFIRSCGYDGISIVACDGALEAVGQTVAQIAGNRGCTGPEAIMDLLLRSEGKAGAVYRMTNEEDLERIMKYPQTMMGTDGEIYTESGLSHPRLFGTAPRILGRYVREKKVLTLEEAVRKMTSLPAKTTGLSRKGLVREGFDADLVLLDPKRIIDHATYGQPTLGNDGIAAVLINGRISVLQGRQTDQRPGRVLRR